MNKFKIIYALFGLLITHFSAHSAEENLISGLSGNEISAPESEIVVRDSWYLQYIAESTEDYFATLSSIVKVKLWFDDSERKLYDASWAISITYDLVLTQANGEESIFEDQSLDIDFNQTMAYKDICLKLYDDAIYIKAEVLNIEVTTSPLEFEIPEDVHLDLELNANRYYNLATDEEVILNINEDYIDGKVNGEEIEVVWSYIEGAESYDFEWLFIDHPNVTGIPDYPLLGELSGPYNFDNATRVNVLTTDYKINLVYPRGLFLFRARPVGKKLIDGTVVRIEGKWSLPNLVDPTTDVADFEKLEYEGFMMNRNWQYQAGFVSEGKRGESIAVYDGGLKSRQNVTLNSADNTVILNQTIYDYQGRAAISLLPTPQENEGLGFYPDRTLRTEGDQYDFDNFDIEGKYDSPDGMNGTSLNKYYSNDGTSFGSNEDYIADAGDYPFARTTFTKDGTGRIRSQTAVGSSVIGSKDLGLEGAKLTTYYYGTPVQEELYRLFGSEVGNVEYYKKNAVIDQNGQAHIQYIDMSGRVIATALAGDAPDNLLEIDSYPESFDVITADLSLNNIFNKDGELFLSKRIAVTYPTNYSFTYDLLGNAYENACLTLLDHGLLPDVKYDVKIYIENEDHERVNLDLAGIIPADADGDPLTYYREGVSEMTEPSVTWNLTLDPGEYTITKVLSLNLAYLEELKENYFASQICFELEVTEGSPCNESCEDQCFLSNGNYNELGNRVFHDTEGIVVAEEVMVDGILTYIYYNDHAEGDGSLDAIFDLIEACEILCDGGPYVPKEPCELKKEAMLRDISKGGQYFENTPFGAYEPIGGDNNAWLIAEFGIDPPGIETSWDDVRENWESLGPDYAEDFLLVGHPEYCIYAMSCGAGENVLCQSAFEIGGGPVSYPDCPDGFSGSVATYNLLTTTTVEITDPSFYHLFNPTDVGYNPTSGTLAAAGEYQFVEGPLATDDLDPFIVCRPLIVPEINTRLLEYYEIGTSGNFHTIWYVINNPDNLHTDWATYGYDEEVGDFYATLHDPVDGLIGDPEDGKMSKYQFFKGAYYFIRDYVEYHFLDDYPIACPSECDGETISRLDDGAVPDGITDAGFQIRFTKNSIFDDYVLGVDPTYGDDVITAPCEDYCESSAEGWINQLEECSDLTDPIVVSSLIIARTYFVEICETGCGEETPYGTDDISPTTISGSGEWGALGSFEDVVARFNLETGSSCETILHPLTDFPELTTDCECEKITLFLENFYISVGLEIPADFNDILGDLTSGVDHTADFLEAIEEMQTPAEDEGTSYTISDIQEWASDCDSGIELDLTEVLTAFKCPVDFPEIDLDSEDEDCGDYIDAIENHFNAIEHLKKINLGWLDYLNGYTSAAWNNIESREVFTMEYELQEYHYTLFYYDQAGNLIKTVPPSGIYRKDNNGVEDDGIEDEHSSTLTALEIQDCKDHVLNPVLEPYVHPSHELVTNYKYNSLQQLIEQSTPDGGNTIYWYDELGRLIVSQNARQLALGNVYSYTSYDLLGRVIEAGEIVASTAMDDPTATNAAAYDLWKDAGSKSEVVRTIYSDYQQNTSEIASQMGLDTEAELLNLRGRIGSVVYYRGIFDDTDLNDFSHASHYNYDYAGNVKTVIHENGLLYDDLATTDAQDELQYVRTDYTYDLISGNVIQVDYQKNRPDQFYYRYEYDDNNRLTVSYSSHDGEIWEKESKNFYYAHGPLARQEIGEQIVQACDYVYTVNGWLKTVNSSINSKNNDAGNDGLLADINQNIGRDAMGFSLHYFEEDYQAVNTLESENLLVTVSNPTFDNSAHDLYNGNIHQMVTSLNNINENGMGVIANTYRYDQLQRIKSSNVFESKTLGNSSIRDNNEISIATADDHDRFTTGYSFDGNGNLLTLTRKAPDAVTSVGELIDNFSYHYNYTPGGDPTDITTNQLTSVTDEITYGVSTVDVDNQLSDNYAYDAIGQLILDKSNDISNIEWTVTGKVKKISYDNSLNPALTTGTQYVSFEYDAMGIRVSKEVYTKVTVPATTETPGYYYYTKAHTYYMHDASGNVLATYTHDDNINESGAENVVLDEHHIYGSKRLGTTNEQKDMNLAGIYIGSDTKHRILGQKTYELSNHLGNVLSTVSDRLLVVDEFTYDEFGEWTIEAPDGNVEYYDADVTSTTEYYPYGMVLRSETDGSGYRYGFQGQEMDDEVKGEGNSVNYKYRMHDPRIGRFFGTDPLAGKYPYLTPYQFSSNQPIHARELEGLESSDELSGWGAYAAGAMEAEKKALESGKTREYYYAELTAKQANSVIRDVEKAVSEGKDVSSAAYYYGYYKTLAPNGTVTPEMIIKARKDGAMFFGSILGLAAIEGIIAKYGIKAVVSFLAEEGIEYAVEVVTGIPIIVDPMDVIQWLRKQGYKQITKEGIEKYVKKMNPCGCFTAGTDVLTNEGYKRIEEIQKGDLVWAFDDSTGSVELKEVSATFSLQRNEIYRIHVEGEIIEATKDHPFFVGGNWMKVENLSKGDSLTLYDGSMSIIDSIKSEKGIFQVYNFEVKDFHTYYVSESSILVHNSPCFGFKKAKDFKRKHSDELITSSSDYTDIKKLSDEDLIKSVTNPENGNYVTVNSNTGTVIDGNTRLYEIERRGLPDDIPYVEHDPNLDEYFPDFE